MSRPKGDPEGTERLIRRINENPPTREQMVAYAKACGELPPERRNLEVHVITWAQLFPDHHDQGESAFFRMQALARLVSEDSLPGWAEPKDTGGLLTRHALFAAAATEPVVQQDGELTFSRESLLKRAFRFAKETRRSK